MPLLCIFYKKEKILLDVFTAIILIKILYLKNKNNWNDSTFTKLNWCKKLIE